MTKPARLLFLSHRLPYPPHNGAAIRTWNILRLLAAEFEVAGLCFDRPDHHLAHVPLAERLAAMESHGRFTLLRIPQLTSRLRLLADHARSVATGRPYTWYVHESGEAHRALGELLDRFDPDVVHVDSMDMVRLLPQLAGRPTVLTHHNVESQLLERRSAGESAAWRRHYLHLQAERLRRAEAEWMPRVALNVVVSPEDEEVFRDIAPTARYAVIPNGVDIEYFQPHVGPTDGCVFVGGTTWHPNRDALHWFAGEILPRLRARGETSPVTWVGRVTEEERRAFDGVDGLQLTGYVDDIRPYLARAACFIAPLRFGGGTRLKLLDAWAMGKAIVSTSSGAEGLGGVDGEDLLLAEDADRFADAVVRVLRDPALRARLEAGGRAAVETRFSWEVIGRRMSDLYRGVSGLKYEGAATR
ncbi:MAG: glycosyltransferase family 4 protein [Gemmatimonadales bacterium]